MGERGRSERSGGERDPSQGKGKKILSWSGTVVALGFIVFAIWLFVHTLHQYDMHEVVARLGQIPAHRLALAGICVALSYGIQACYDFLAARSVGVDVSPGRAILAALVGNSLTNSIGFSLVTGTSVRYRYYLAWGFSALQIAEVIALAKLAFVNGLTLSTGLSQIFAPIHLPAQLPLSLSPRAIGFILLLPTAILLLWNGFSRGGTLALGKFRLERPRQAMLIMQVAVACTHFAFAAAALYFLLPDADLRQAGYATPLAFLGTFMAIKFAALFLPIPGSLGVLEAASMAVLTPAMPAYPVLGGLLAFRLAFYVLPFAIGLLTLAGYELSAKKGFLPSLLRRRRARRLA
jgi:uncharacterized membrane protein YbhN (UPF0104 family)